MELSFQLSGVSFEEGEAFLLITLIYFFIHGFFLDDLLGDVERLAGTLLVEHRGSVCRFESRIETAILASRGGYKCTVQVSIEVLHSRESDVLPFLIFFFRPLHRTGIEVQIT